MVSAQFINKHNKISEVSITKDEHTFLCDIVVENMLLENIKNYGVDIKHNKKLYYLFYPSFYKNKKDKNTECKIIVTPTFIDSNVLCVFLDTECIDKDILQLNDYGRFIVKKRTLFSPVILFNKEYSNFTVNNYNTLLNNSKLEEYLPHNFVPHILPTTEDDRKKMFLSYSQYLVKKGYTDIDTLNIIYSSVYEIYIKRNKIFLDHLYSHTVVLSQNIPLPLIIYWDINRDTNPNSENLRNELAQDYVNTISLFKL